MEIGQIVTVVTPNYTAPAMVVGKGTAKLNAAGDTQPYVGLRVFTAAPGELPYFDRVPAYDTAAAATAREAGIWSAYTCWADPDAVAPALSIPDTTQAPVAPVEEPPAPAVQFEDE